MSQADATQCQVPVDDIDDIEWEILCSDREAGLGAFPDYGEGSPETARDMVPHRPWTSGGVTTRA